MPTIDPQYALHGTDCTLVIDCREGKPSLAYVGPRLHNAEAVEGIAVLSTRQEAQANVEREARIHLSPEPGSGYPGTPGLQVHRNGTQWSVDACLDSVEEGDGSLLLRSSCSATGVSLEHHIALDSSSNVFRAMTRMTNTGESELAVDRCDAPCVPLPDALSTITGFEGRWANEFQMRRVDSFFGTYLRESRAGRTSHDTFPGVVLHTDSCGEFEGEALGLHLGWSGNHRLSVERLSNGLACARFGELFFPGELSLAPGESYESPWLYGAASSRGFNSMSACFHRYLRQHLTDERVADAPKPVHFNSWEALYFDLSVDKLIELADAAADVGVERFVLDDGWFPGRDDDTAGLGDWYVDKKKFPNGLGPVVEHVNARGMQFGLWVEPEMVNPDSDLYRAHPDWALNADPREHVMARNQLVLNLTLPEVQDYLFERIDALVSEYPITYLKWDMNRDLHQPGGRDGRAVTHRQTLALYELLGRIRAKHKNLEIESCSSGGARADFGVLAHTDRIWTSDSNDALDRIRIQQGFSMFFPPEVLGSHVGPRECHITGRTLSMSLRAGVAIMADMGIEANPARPGRGRESRN